MSTSAGHVVAIDGGAATGKTTSAARVAERLGFSYVDSGAVYRTIALALARRGIDDAGDARIPELLPELDIRIDPEVESFRLLLEGEAVGTEIRTQEAASMASKLAVRPDVRDLVRRLLRDARSRGSLVVEGRDIGTVVFPDATLKVFLVADAKVRARRRRRDLRDQGMDVPVEEVERDILERDRRDATREVSPLRQADDARVLDTSDMDLDEQVERILAIYEEATQARRRGVDRSE